MPRGSRGSHVSIHDGQSGKNTCIVIASGTCPEALVADIKEVAEQTSGYDGSTFAPQAEAKWDGDRLRVSGEGSNLKVLVGVIEQSVAHASTMSTMTDV